MSDSILRIVPSPLSVAGFLVFLPQSALPARHFFLVRHRLFFAHKRQMGIQKNDWLAAAHQQPPADPEILQFSSE
jgi:hypothetical protein